MDNNPIIRSVKDEFTVSMILKKSSPPIKLKRSMTKSVTAETNIVNDEQNLSTDSGGEQLKTSVNSELNISRPRLRRRQYITDKNRKRISDGLGTVLNGSNSRNSLDSDVGIDDVLVSINSHNIKTIMARVENNLNCKSSEKMEQDESKLVDVSFENKSLESVTKSVDVDDDEDGIIKDTSEIVLEPVFSGYQLVGDSQLLRFAQHILGMQRKIDSNGKGWLGLCVGGQRICDLHRRVLEGLIPIGKQLIVLIGTNDVLKGTTVPDMCRGLVSLLKTLFKSAEKIILLTLPPVPKLAYLEEHWIKLKKYNEYILSLKDNFKDRLEIVDISPKFYQPTIRKCNLSLFEMWFEGPLRRPDLVHFNKSGFKLIKESLKEKIL